jgi:hypothetical protein
MRGWAAPAALLVVLAGLAGCEAEGEWRYSTNGWDNNRWRGDSGGGLVISGDGCTGAVVLGIGLAILGISELIRQCTEP